MLERPPLWKEPSPCDEAPLKLPRDGAEEAWLPMPEGRCEEEPTVVRVELGRL